MVDILKIDNYLPRVCGRPEKTIQAYLFSPNLRNSKKKAIFKRDCAVWKVILLLFIMIARFVRNK